MDDTQIKAKIDRLYARYLARIKKVVTPEEFEIWLQWNRDVKQMGADAPQSDALRAVAGKVSADARCVALHDELSALAEQRWDLALTTAVQRVEARLPSVLTASELLAYTVYLDELRQGKEPTPQRPPHLQRAKIKIACDAELRALVDYIHEFGLRRRRVYDDVR